MSATGRARLALAAAIGIAPFAALNFWLLSYPEFPRALWPVLLFLEAPWATAPLTVVLGGLMFGQPPAFGSVFRRLVVALPALFLMHVILRCALTMTMILFWLVPARLWFASEVILLERSSGWKVDRPLYSAHAGSAGRVYLAVARAAFFRAGLRALLLAGNKRSGQGAVRERAHVGAARAR